MNKLTHGAHCARSCTAILYARSCDPNRKKKRKKQEQSGDQVRNGYRYETINTKGTTTFDQKKKGNNNKPMWWQDTCVSTMYIITS